MQRDSAWMAQCLGVEVWCVLPKQSVVHSFQAALLLFRMWVGVWLAWVAAVAACGLGKLSLVQGGASGVGG